MALNFIALIKIDINLFKKYATLKTEVMKNIYTAYSKEINGKTFFFVKKYNVFPEYENFPQVLDSMGMHTDFYKACNIVKIDDKAVVKGLLDELHIPDSEKTIQIHRVKGMTHTLIKNTHHAILKLRLAGIN